MVDHAVAPRRDDVVRSTPSADMAPTFAALDLGTNNCRLLIAAPTRHGFRVIDSFSRFVRLGEGLHGSGRLSDAAMDRTIGALHACAARIGRRRLGGLRAVATEACRRAANGQDFLDRVRHETGLSIDVISTREEAELALESCATLLQAELPERPNVEATDPDDAGSARWRDIAHPPAFDRLPVHDCPPVRDRLVDGVAMTGGGDRTCSRALLFDIGGGSTEIAWARIEDGAGPELIGYQSLPLGVITLADLFGADAHTQSGYAAMVEHVVAQLRAFEAVHCISREVGRGTVRLLGTSGTVTTLAGVVLGLKRYRRAQVDGIVLSRGAAQDAIGVLRDLGPDGLRLHPCVGSERAACVLPGCAIFEAIHRLWPTDGVVVADRGLRGGMLLRMMRDRHPYKTGLGHGRSRPATRGFEPHRLAEGRPAATPAGLLAPVPAQATVTAAAVTL